MGQHFDSIHSDRLSTEFWERKTYGTLRGIVRKNVARNDDGTFRAITNRSPEVLVMTSKDAAAIRAATAKAFLRTAGMSAKA